MQQQDKVKIKPEFRWHFDINRLKGILHLKKKLWEQIITAAEDLGDPTNVETGWDVQFKRVKTGPLPYNVEYQLQALKCKTRALTEDELDLISDLKSMDEVMPRPTPDAQKELLDRIRDAGSEEIDETIEEEFNIAWFYLQRIGTSNWDKRMSQLSGRKKDTIRSSIKCMNK